MCATHVGFVLGRSKSVPPAVLDRNSENRHDLRLAISGWLNRNFAANASTLRPCWKGERPARQCTQTCEKGEVKVTIGGKSLALTYGLGVEIWRCQMLGYLHGAAVSHVEAKPPRISRVSAAIEHLAGVIVEHHTADSRQLFVWWGRAELYGNFQKVFCP